MVHIMVVHIMVAHILVHLTAIMALQENIMENGVIIIKEEKKKGTE
jgi:hypothetical protein